MTRRFETLDEKEVLSLAIHVERANAARFRAFADSYVGHDELHARFSEMAGEELAHERTLVEELHRQFGDAAPVAVTEDDVKEVIESFDLDDGEHQLFDSLPPGRILELALRCEGAARQFYQKAAAGCQNDSLRRVYSSLARLEGEHADWLERRIASEKPGTRR